MFLVLGDRCLRYVDIRSVIDFYKSAWNKTEIDLTSVSDKGWNYIKKNTVWQEKQVRDYVRNNYQIFVDAGEFDVLSMIIQALSGYHPRIEYSTIKTRLYLSDNCKLFHKYLNNGIILGHTCDGNQKLVAALKRMLTKTYISLEEIIPLAMATGFYFLFLFLFFVQN